MRIRRSQLTLAIISLLFVAVTVFVQRQLARDDGRPDTNQTRQSPVKGNTSDASPISFQDYDRLEFERTIVRDSPFSATVIVETNERMQDGTFSTKTMTSLIYRDSKGRTRRDWFPAPLSSAKVEPTRSVINDPVAGFTYELDHKATSAERKVLLRLPARSSAASETTSKEASGQNEILPMPSTFGTGSVMLRTEKTSDSAPKNPESLGTRQIEGILAEGTRLSFTVPAVSAGNNTPMEIAAERWYAPALQTVVLLKRTDSRYGETTYRFADINRGEPAAALFIVPPTYKIHDERDVSNSRQTP